MINLDPAQVPTIKYGKTAKLGTYDLEEIEYVGEPLADFMNIEFDVLRKPVSNNLWKSFLPRPIRNAIYSKPVIDPAICVRCGVCISVCPVEGKALNFKYSKKDPPVYNYNKCIRCYCCQEMCPHKAISVKGH